MKKTKQIPVNKKTKVQWIRQADCILFGCEKFNRKLSDLPNSLIN